MIKIDRDGKWDVHSGVRFLIETSAAFEERRRLDRIASEAAKVERDRVQAERDRCIAYLKKQKDLTKVDLEKKGYSELTLEMSFEDIIESVRINKEAEINAT